MIVNMKNNIFIVIVGLMVSIVTKQRLYTYDLAYFDDLTFIVVYTIWSITLYLYILYLLKDLSKLKALIPYFFTRTKRVSKLIGMFYQKALINVGIIYAFQMLMYGFDKEMIVGLLVWIAVSFLVIMAAILELRYKHIVICMCVIIFISNMLNSLIVYSWLKVGYLIVINIIILTINRMLLMKFKFFN